MTTLFKAPQIGEPRSVGVKNGGVTSYDTRIVKPVTRSSPLPSKKKGGRQPVLPPKKSRPEESQKPSKPAKLPPKPATASGNSPITPAQDRKDLPVTESFNKLEQVGTFS